MTPNSFFKASNPVLSPKKSGFLGRNCVFKVVFSANGKCIHCQKRIIQQRTISRIRTKYTVPN